MEASLDNNKTYFNGKRSKELRGGEDEEEWKLAKQKNQEATAQPMGPIWLQAHQKC